MHVSFLLEINQAHPSTSLQTHPLQTHLAGHQWKIVPSPRVALVGRGDHPTPLGILLQWNKF